MKHRAQHRLTTAALLGLTLACPGQVQAQSVGPPDQWPRTLMFAGYTWAVKGSNDPVGPGPNPFSDTPEAVRVDPQGRLHLRLLERDGQWRAAEVSLREALGYGNYSFTIGAVDDLDPNVVLGLFTWSDDPAEDHREIDIEISRWGAADNANAQYVVQPYATPGSTVRFDLPPGLTSSRHSIRWTPDGVSCASEGWRGEDQQPESVHHHAFAVPTPSPGEAHARINLWLILGQPPSDGRGVAVVIHDFQFTPHEVGDVP